MTANDLIVVQNLGSGEVKTARKTVAIELSSLEFNVNKKSKLIIKEPSLRLVPPADQENLLALQRELGLVRKRVDTERSLQEVEQDIARELEIVAELSKIVAPHREAIKEKIRVAREKYDAARDNLARVVADIT